MADHPGPQPRVVPPIPPAGDALVLSGFGLALAATLLRWSRFGGSRAYLGAWVPHWALVAAVATLAGLLFASFVRFRSVDPRLAIAVVTVLAVGGAVGALAHLRNPPLLAESTAAPVITVAGCAMALAGAVRKTSALVRARRGVG